MNNIKMTVVPSYHVMSAVNWKPSYSVCCQQSRQQSRRQRAPGAPGSRQRSAVFVHLHSLCLAPSTRPQRSSPIYQLLQLPVQLYWQTNDSRIHLQILFTSSSFNCGISVHIFMCVSVCFATFFFEKCLKCGFVYRAANTCLLRSTQLSTRSTWPFAAKIPLKLIVFTYSQNKK